MRKHLKLKNRVGTNYEVDRVNSSIIDLFTPINASHVAYLMNRPQHIIPDLKKNGKGIPVRFAADLRKLFVHLLKQVAEMHKLAGEGRQDLMAVTRFWALWDEIPVKWLNVFSNDLPTYRRVYAARDKRVPELEAYLDQYFKSLKSDLINDLDKLK